MSSTSRLTPTAALKPQCKGGHYEGDGNQDRRGSIHFRGYREADHRVDFDWEGNGVWTRGKEGDDKIIK